MTEQGPETGSGIDPEQDAHVRALLGEVGAQAEPIPADVSARLDDTLAMLRAERSGTTDVVPLRRRWLPRAAAAAAAVIVLGVGGIAAVRLGTEDPSSQNSAASGGAASDTTTLPGTPTGAPVPSAGSGATPGSKSRALRESADAVRALPAVTSAAFAGDVVRLLRQDASLVTPAERAAESGEESGTASPAPGAAQRSQDEALLTQECPGPAVTGGAVANPVRVDGALAVLLVHPPKGGEQLVEAWTCAGDRRLDSTQVTGADVTP